MGVTALAVVPEPWPFWDGRDEHERVDAWRQQVGWKPAWGSVAPAGRVNGSSGQVVRDRILGPLGYSLDEVWLTDALPFFHVHRGPKTQGAAMTEQYDTFAAGVGLLPHELPDRPSTQMLISQAIRQEGSRLLAELNEPRAPLLVTLGNEALAVAAGLLEGAFPMTLGMGADYGKRVHASLAGRDVQVLPLVHPGQRSAAWAAAHNRWIATCT